MVNIQYKKINVANNVTILSKDEIFGPKRLSCFDSSPRVIYPIASVTDWVSVNGVKCTNTTCLPRVYKYYLKDRGTIMNSKKVYMVTEDSKTDLIDPDISLGIRPVIDNVEFSDISQYILMDYKNGTYLVNYGEYPQTQLSEDDSLALEDELIRGYVGNLKDTNIHYYFHYKDMQEYVDTNTGQRYARSTIFSFDSTNKPSWFKVEPIRWIYDENSKKLISEKLLFYYSYDNNSVDFELSNLHKVLNGPFATLLDKTQDHVIDDMLLSFTEETDKPIEKEKQQVEKQVENPYNFNFGEVSEEDIIRGAIESGVAVFLHGRSSEGKSARIKQIDPDCIKIYLRNATPESLNGKSAMNEQTGQLEDIKPTWLEKLEEKCAAEPDKKHIVFFDEITNALPSLQGAAFNIVLDREVNGKWNLPENARVVAAGNEMEDSLAANQMAEPLFNRFAHVYINTTVDKWLIWANENDIHPSIYTFIACYGEDVLRTEYTGETPNADPRKWEMASTLLKDTKNPNVLRALIGEELTNKFIEFCRLGVLTLEDIISDNYDIENVKFTTKDDTKFATIMNLANVDETNLVKARDFAAKLGTKYLALFDTLWSHNDEERLLKILEVDTYNKRI